MIWLIIILVGVGVIAVAAFLIFDDKDKKPPGPSPEAETKRQVAFLQKDYSQIKSSHSALHGELERLRAQQTAVASGLASEEKERRQLAEQLALLVKDRQGQTQVLEDRVKELRQQVKLRQQGVSQGRKEVAAIETLQQEIDGLKKQYLGLQQELAQGEGGASPLIGDLQMELANVKEQYADLQQELEQAKQDISLWRGQADGTPYRISKIAQEAEAVSQEKEEQIKKLEEVIGELSERLKGQAERLAQIQDREKRITGLQQELDNMKAQHNALRGQLEASVQKTTALEQELAGQEKKQQKLAQSSEDEDARLEALNDELRQVRAQYQELQNELAQVGKKAYLIEDDLHSQEEERQQLLEELRHLNEAKEEQIRMLDNKIGDLQSWIKEQGDFVTYFKKSKEGPEEAAANLTQEETLKLDANLKEIRGSSRKRIGRVLLDEGRITEDMLKEAIEFQLRFGGGITQYLVAFGYITEDDLARCVSAQFGVPYISLKMYSIPQEIIDLIPVDVVMRYCLVPVDREGDIITLVMADPLDAKAIKQVQEVTGSQVRPYVGLISDIMETIESYYSVSLEKKDITSSAGVPAVVYTEIYKGFERRGAIRMTVGLDISVPLEDRCINTQTKDVSSTGLSFEWGEGFTIGLYLTIQIKLPQEAHPSPIMVLVQVMRSEPLANGMFHIGTRFTKIAKEELGDLLDYARSKIRELTTPGEGGPAD